MNEEQRQSALWSYYETENCVRVNAQCYRISLSFERDGVFFYAVHMMTHDEGPTVLIPRELWEKLDCGLKIAYAYNCVLAHFEHVLR